MLSIESSGSGGRGLAQTQNTTLFKFKPHWKRPSVTEQLPSRRRYTSVLIQTG